MSAPSSIGETLHRARASGLLLPDPLDFLWHYVKESRTKARLRDDRGIALWLGSVPAAVRPSEAARPEWNAAFDMLVWRYNDVVRRPGKIRHTATLKDGWDPDHALAARGLPCEALSVCLAQPPWPEISARRFSRWLHGVHEIVVLERRLRYPTEAIILPWQMAGRADPLVPVREPR